MAIDTNMALVSWEQRKLEEYVTYHTKEWKNSPDYGSAIAYFDNKYYYGRMELKAKSQQQQVNSLKTNLDKESLNTILALENANFLDNILAKIGQGFDEVVQKQFSQILNNFQSITMGVRASNGGLSSQQQFQAFVIEIDKALSLINQQGLDRNIVQTLINNIGSETPTNVTKMIDRQQIEQHRKILTYLDSAVKKINTNGAISKSSFSGYVSNIFNTVIGESLAQEVLSNVINKVDKEIIKQLSQAGSLSNIKVILNNNLQLSGTDIDITGRTSKSDIVNSNALTLSGTVNDTNVIINLDTNFSVKWKDKGNKITIQNSSPLMQWTGGGPGNYYAYNLLAHRSADPEGFKTLKAGICASFLNEWIAGSGALIEGKGFNTAQFIIINGKVYSINHIIGLIADELKDDVGGRRPVNIDVTSSSNQNPWVPGAPSWKLARQRSNMVKDVINKFRISAYFNKNILSKYIIS